MQLLNHVWLLVTPWTTRLPCPSLSPRACSNSCYGVGDAIQPCSPQSSPSLPAFNLSRHQSFPIIQLFSQGGQSIGASASASFLPMNIQGWFPLELTGLTSLQSKGLSRVFSNTIVWKHQFFVAKTSIWSNSLQEN